MPAMKKRTPLANPLLGYAADGQPIFGVVPQGRFRYPVPNRDGKHTIGCYLVFICPGCHLEICHTGTYRKPGDGDGHRERHCNCWLRGYYIREVTTP